jgi:hypothetical protein
VIHHCANCGNTIIGDGDVGAFWFCDERCRASSDAVQTVEMTKLKEEITVLRRRVHELELALANGAMP